MTDVAFPFLLVLACTKTGQCPLQAHKQDENKPHREKIWLESCFQYRWLFKVSLTRFEWVAKWHFGQLLLCYVNRSSFLFDYSSNKRSVYLNVMMCSWAASELPAGQYFPFQKLTRTDYFNPNWTGDVNIAMWSEILNVRFCWYLTPEAFIYVFVNSISAKRVLSTVFITHITSIIVPIIMSHRNEGSCANCRLCPCYLSYKDRS